MMSYRFKLAGVLLSAGLAMTACGGGEEGTDGSDGAPEENGQDTEQSSQENSGSDDAEDTPADEGMKIWKITREMAGMILQTDSLMVPAALLKRFRRTGSAMTHGRRWMPPWRIMTANSSRSS